VLDGDADSLRNNEDVKEFYLGLSTAGRRASATSRATSAASGGYKVDPSGRRGTPSGGGERATNHAELHQRLGRALAGRLRLAIGASRFAPDGRLASWDDALVPGVDGSLLDSLAREACAAGLRQPASPTALAINSFLNWRTAPEMLELAGLAGFRELHFAARCPTGVRGTPPLLDVVALGDQGVVAVAARSVEYLAESGGRLAPAYGGLRLRDGLAAWGGLLGGGDGSGAPRFRRVDAPALVKKAIGLANTFPDRRVRLLYLFLEPEDAAGLGPVRGPPRRAGRTRGADQRLGGRAAGAELRRALGRLVGAGRAALAAGHRRTAAGPLRRGRGRLGGPMLAGEAARLPRGGRRGGGCPR
jgi:hypothetical protein